MRRACRLAAITPSAAPAAPLARAAESKPNHEFIGGKVYDCAMQLDGPHELAWPDCLLDSPRTPSQNDAGV